MNESCLRTLCTATLLLGAALPTAALGGAEIPIEIVAPDGRAEAALPAAIALLPGEASEPTDLLCEEDGEALPVRGAVLARHTDGSAARIRLLVPPGGGHRLVTCRPAGDVDPALVALRDPTELGNTGPTLPPAGVEMVIGDAASFLMKAHRDPGPPAWWDEVRARLSSEIDPADLDGQLDFVATAYAEKGRPREAIRLYAEIAAAARGRDERARLRARYEIARLYEVFLDDFPRALAGYLGCARFPLENPGEARQNRIAASFGCLRVLEAEANDRAPALYRLLARDLLLARDPYGDLLLPEVFLRLGDTLRSRGEAESARRAYRAAAVTAERLPPQAPPNYRAPLSSARVALRVLEAEGLEFTRVPDGTFEGEALGYNAPVTVRVGFHSGRLVTFHVTGFDDKRPLDAYRVLPDRVLEAQGLGVDGVSGATVTSRALLNAAAGAILDGRNGGGSGGGE